VLRWPGPLVREFHAQADRVALEPYRRIRAALRLRRRTRRLAVEVEERAAGRVLDRFRPRLAYLNSVKAACYVRPALERGIPVVLHLHERESLASTVLARHQLDRLYGRIALVACSRQVASDTARITGVPEDRVSVIASCIDVGRVRGMSQEGQVPQPATPRQQVGAVGSGDHGKGFDLWLKVARRVAELASGNAPSFVWVGHVDHYWQRQARELASEADIELVGATDNPYRPMAEMDLLTVPCREAAFPLVVLEAMALRTPVVAFDVGGIRDQLASTGELVPAENVEAMAAAVLELLDDAPRRDGLAEAAAKRVERFFDASVFREKIVQLVTPLIDRNEPVDD